MIARWMRAAAGAAMVLALAAPAQAHVFGAGGAGLFQGFEHPFSGLDHLLAMIAVGLWAAQIGGRAIFLLPIAFPLMMALGAAAGVLGMPLPGVEYGVAASVVALGLLIAFGAKPPLAVSAPLVGLFALLHGYAHGAELPEAASPFAYGAGFIVATIILHAIGVGAGLLLRGRAALLIPRLAGTGIAAAGLLIAANIG